MSDGIKAWHEEEESKAYKALVKRIESLSVDDLINGLQGIQRNIEWLNQQSLRLTKGEHMTIDSIYTRVTNLLAGKKS